MTAAFFLNVSTALVDADVVKADNLVWQLIVLILAVVVLLALLIAVRGILAYAAAGTWALIGIAVTGVTEGPMIVAVFSLVAAGILVAATVILRLSGHNPATTAFERS